MYKYKVGLDIKQQRGTSASLLFLHVVRVKITQLLLQPQSRTQVLLEQLAQPQMPLALAL